MIDFGLQKKKKVNPDHVNHLLLHLLQHTGKFLMVE